MQDDVMVATARSPIRRPGKGPVDPCSRASQLARMRIDDIDLVEINEASAAQVIPSTRGLGVDELNVNGGPIAVGSPFRNGARVTNILLNSLRWHEKRWGLETERIGGRRGMAMIVERLS